MKIPDRNTGVAFISDIFDALTGLFDSASVFECLRDNYEQLRDVFDLNNEYFCLKTMTTDNMLNLNYITDAAGNQIAVQIPMSDWLLFQKEYQEIKRKLEVLAGIKEALNEVQQARKKNQKLQTLTEFLNEC